MNTTPANGNRKRKTLEEVLKNINRDFVQIKKKEQIQNNIILYSVLKELLKRMKENTLSFKNMKPEVEYMGSYYDGLRVGHSTEFDLNIVLKLPIDYRKIVLEGTKADFCAIRMPSEFRRLCKTKEMIDKGFCDTQLWCDKEFRLSVRKFRSWMQSVVDAGLSDLPLHNGKRILAVRNVLFEISSKTYGPANTLTISTFGRRGPVIDVDLVPTFMFKLPKKPINSEVLFDNVEISGKKQYFAVPKPSENDFSWRLAFPFQERWFMDNKQNLKSCVKLIKLLRDAQGFKQLASYYIKTLFLSEIVKKPATFWHSSLSQLVIYMMRKLRDCLANGQIKNFWCPEDNLLKKLKLETSQNWSKRLSIILKVIQHRAHLNPCVIYEYFTV